MLFCWFHYHATLACPQLQTEGKFFITPAVPYHIALCFFSNLCHLMLFTRPPFDLIESNHPALFLVFGFITSPLTNPFQPHSAGYNAHINLSNYWGRGGKKTERRTRRCRKEPRTPTLRTAAHLGASFLFILSLISPMLLYIFFPSTRHQTYTLLAAHRHIGSTWTRKLKMWDILISQFLNNCFPKIILREGVFAYACMYDFFGGFFQIFPTTGKGYL